MEQKARDKDSPHTSKQGGSGIATFLIPRRACVHTGLRLALAIALNVVLAASMSWHPSDPYHASASAAWIPILQIAATVAALLALLPVFLFGRDIPRLLAIGLSVFPAYLLVADAVEITQMMLAG